MSNPGFNKITQTLFIIQMIRFGLLFGFTLLFMFSTYEHSLSRQLNEVIVGN